MDLTPVRFLTLSPRPAQRLQLTAQMHQALRILQMPRADLKSYLEEELTANPFLEEKQVSDDHVFLDRWMQERDFTSPEREDMENEEDFTKDVRVREEISLHNHLLSQWNLLNLPDSQTRTGREIIENLNERGYLVSSLAEIAENCDVKASDVQKALLVVQSLDPPGVACRDLSECLILQMRRRGLQDERLMELVKKIVENHLQDVQAGKLHRVAKKLNITVQGVQTALGVMRTLNPRPGSAFGVFRPSYVVPDVVFRRKRGGYEVLCNKKDLPDLKICGYYRKLLKDSHTSTDVREYLREKLDSALALLRAVEKRASTLERLAQCFAKDQAAFLAKGPSYLRPFCMEQLAKRLGLHKSTVSRAVAHKYAETPHGVVALRTFFSNAVGQNENVHSSAAIQDRIRSLIAKEFSGRPLSDGAIMKLLKSQGMCVARRTVVKYRQKMRILSSYSRKQ